MIELTGTAALTRLILRRDRLRILLWILGSVGIVAATTASFKGLYPTQAALDQAAAAVHGNAAAIAFNGPDQGLNTVGGEVAFQGGAFGMVLTALMSLLMIGRLTRGEEEAGRLDMVRSLPVGDNAPAVAAAFVVVAMNAAIALLTTVLLLLEQLPLAGSIAFGLSFFLVGVLFGGIAGVAAQVTENTRVVYGSAGAVLGAAYILRAVGDIGDGTISWLSPIGWAQKARPFAGERWWPFLLIVAALAIVVVAAGVLGARRDLGGGLVRPQPGRAVASPWLGHPLGLAFRLQRGSLTGWSAGLVFTGIAYGGIAPTVDKFIAANKQLAEMMARAGGGASLIDSYLATSFRVMAIVATCFAVQSALRLRSEETALRAEPVLATPVSRWSWAASHLSVAFLGSVIVLVVAGLTTGASYWLAGGGLGVVPRSLGGAIVYAPAIWVLIGLTVAFVGLAPRVAGTPWAILALCFIVGFLGELLNLPRWLHDLSPFERVPQLPAAPLSVGPIAALTAIAGALTLVGLVGLRRRDIG